MLSTVQTPIDWYQFSSLIHAGNNFIITIHHRPDGDCIGSALAMQCILHKLGKKCRIVSPDPIPAYFDFLDPTGSIEILSDNTSLECDVFLAIDTSSWAQLGTMAKPFRESRSQKIVLDHHALGDEICTDMFVDSLAPATGRLVIAAVDVLGVTLCQKIALPAFVALATDTGWFHFASVTPDTFQTASRLLATGIKASDVYRELYEQESLARALLVGRTLQKVEVYSDGQFLLTWIRQEDLKASGALPSDTEDIVNMLLKVKGSRMAALLSELKDGTVKLSLRSRCEVDCSLLASRFGGGGHKKAAGASLAMPFEEAKQVVVNAVVKALK